MQRQGDTHTHNTHTQNTTHANTQFSISSTSFYLPHLIANLYTYYTKNY